MRSLLAAVCLLALMACGGHAPFARHSADDAVAAFRAEGVPILDVATASPSAESGPDTVTRWLTVDASGVRGSVVVSAFANQADRDRFTAMLADPQVAPIAHSCSRDNIVVVLSPPVATALAPRCTAALARLK